MTLYELFHQINDIGKYLTSAQVPLMKDGKEYKIDLAIVTDKDGKVKQINVTEK